MTVPPAFNVHLRPHHAWATAVQNGAQAWARGSGFCDGRLLGAQQLAEALLDLAGHDDNLAERLGCFFGRLNGFWTLVLQNSDGLFAAVDATRSYPIYYGSRGAAVYLSSDGPWVRDRLDAVAPDEVSIAEYLLTGYSTGPCTLFAGVRQMQAGEWLLAVPGAPLPEVSCRFHTRWSHRARGYR